MTMVPGSAQNLVTPTLHRRAAPRFLPATCLAVWKAVRGLDGYVHEAASLCAHTGYELPKKALKSGITTVEMILTDKQVSLFFPDPIYRIQQLGKAKLYDRVRPIMAYIIAFIISLLYFQHNFVPVTTWWDYALAVLPVLWQLALVVFRTMTASLFFFYAICFYMWWGLMKTMIPILANLEGAGPVFVSGTVSVFEWVQAFVGLWISTTQSLICAQFYHGWLCPATPPSIIGRIVDWFVCVLCEGVSLLGNKVFWQSVCLFCLCGVCIEWISRRRTVWKVQLKIESQAFSIARGQKTRATQETISDKVAATPVISPVESYVKSTHPNMPVGLREKYIAICLMITSGWADHRVRVVDTTESEPDTEPVQGSERESLGIDGEKKRLLKTRNNTAPHNTWRDSIRVTVKSWFQLHDDVQKGLDRTLPGADEVKERYSGVVTGPELFDISEGFEGNADDEIAGVSRHLRKLKSTVTGDYLDKPTPEAEERLNKATAIICNIVAAIAKLHMYSLLTWALPKKWGPTRDVMYQRVAEIGWTVILYTLTGFCKLCELALPLTKLPRLVGSMGMLACAKDAALISCVELLFKKYLPHLVVKGKTLDGVCNRFAAFARRAKKFHRKVVSVDMTGMDSSWTEADRMRVRRVLRAVIQTLQGLLDAELQDDYVSCCSAKKKLLVWFLKYIIVQLEAQDAILFSGERGTSIGNRILMLIVWSAELLRVYGDVVGTEKIEKMFYCPEEAHEECTEEKASGQAMTHGYEPVPYVDKFPDDPDMDNNIGDGDDNTLSVDEGMYASAEEFVLSWEAYHKLVVICSSWSENTDMECLSTMVIFVMHVAFFVPKVARNAQRLVAHKISIPPGKHFAEGCYTYTPSKKQYAEIATDLWQRSYSLRHTMVTRHLNRAMFEYCYTKCGDLGTIYNDDMKRLGREDGDVRLKDCLEAVRMNASHDINAWVMVKATHFENVHTLTAPEIKALKREWYASDETWSVLDLTDDLCAHPDVLLDSYPVGVNVAIALNFKREFIDQLTKRQLVKEKGDLPDMGGGTRTGRHEESVPDGAKSIVYSGGVIVYKEASDDAPITIACGYEPTGKKREGMLMVPTGKLERSETYAQGAARELGEEGALCVNPNDLNFVRDSVCGLSHCRQFRVLYNKTWPAGVLTNDRLDEFKFRTVGEIIDEHAPKKIGMCIKDIIKDGKFVFLDTSNAKAPVSSGLHPPSEVKPAIAEMDGTGPSLPEDFSHPHVCPVCATEFTHSHKYNKEYTHRMRMGECVNPTCSMHKSAGKKAVDALTSREQQGIRQPAASSLVNVYGTAHLGSGVETRKAGDTGAGLATPCVNQNVGKSHAKGAESKGKGKGTKGPGKGTKGSGNGAKGPGNGAKGSGDGAKGSGKAAKGQPYWQVAGVQFPTVAGEPTPKVAGEPNPKVAGEPNPGSQGSQIHGCQGAQSQAQTAAKAMTLTPSNVSNTPIVSEVSRPGDTPPDSNGVNLEQRESAATKIPIVVTPLPPPQAPGGVEM